jgi:hypothetical protein
VTKETMDAVAFYANIATLVAVVLTAIALFVTARQLRIGRKAASAGAFIALNESLRQSWLHFSQIDEAGKQYAFADVMNLLESACVIFDEKIFVGQVETLLEDYLCHVFILIQESDDARSRIEQMILTDKTFEHIVRFLHRHRKRVVGIKLPVTT